MSKELKAELKSEEFRLQEELKELIAKSYPEFEGRRLRFAYRRSGSRPWIIPFESPLYGRSGNNWVKILNGKGKMMYCNGMTELVIDPPKGEEGHSDVIGISFCSTSEKEFWKLKGRVETLKRAVTNLEVELIGDEDE